MSTARVFDAGGPVRIGPWSEAGAAHRHYGGHMTLWRLVLTVADLTVALAVTSAVVLMRPVSGWWVWLIAVLLGLPLAVRRRWPRPVLGMVLVATVATVLTGAGAEVSIYALAFAAYPVALSSARAGRWALGAALTGFLGSGLFDALVTGLPTAGVDERTESFSTAPWTVAGYGTVVLAGGWALAWIVRNHRAQTAEIAALQTARAVAEERLRIARDVHDVVGHNLSVIAMRAAVANHLETDRQAALQTIERISRAALDDVRVVLDGLRDTTGDGLERLVGDARVAGLDVTLDAPDLAPLPRELRTSVHDIVREALTNVRRHADATHCRVTVAVSPGEVSLTVVDDGSGGSASPTPGHGLRGMRERAAQHGGRLSAAAEPGGGFAVRARLPIPAVPA
ncbi:MULTISPECIES: sensor histidine kinase [Catenuloplanes]|uniref:histidine kinase n=1 Tax=Catenuloplanes niger TaxID=587534 RepID=A0AAE3ZXM3_9ACTN|nr:sensor histidine kinase [Catenuloplanes niger]MDR7327787.1 signal transduction histidine kinase [Catenuloplanes niger]